MRTINTAMLALAALLSLELPLHAQAQPKPVPFITPPLVPTAVLPGGPGFTLTVNGANFAPSSLVYWNGSPRTTRYRSPTQVQAQILASDYAGTTSAGISVVTPAPNGSSSNTALLEVGFPRTSLNFIPLSVTDADMPNFVAVNDVNRDGNMDLIVTNSSANAVTIFLGHGDGAYERPTSYPVGQMPVSVAVADLNGDGNPDLVVADQNSNQISVLLGNGDGTFQAAVSYGANEQPKSIALGDFNGDGNLDVVVANYSGGHLVSALLGNGDGTFRPAVSYGGPSAGASVALGDFNGDGRLDLAVAQSSPSGVSILLGKGDGKFQGAKFFATDAGAQSVVVADFNGDAKTDLAVACATASDVDILLGKGDGTFQAVTAYPTGQTPYALSAGEINGDGKIDLATANNGGQSVGILLGNGDGTFQAHQDYSLGSGFPLSVVIADLTRDGLPDIAVATDAGAIAVMLQTTVVFSPPNLSFDPQAVGTSSAAQTSTLTDMATVPLGVSGVAIGGAAPGDFSQTNTCNVIPSGGACTISVTFTPQAAGTRSAMLHVIDTAPNSPQIVFLKGVGLQPAVTLSPASLTFPVQVVSTTSAAQTVTLTNTGDAALSITGITTTGNFSQTNTCGTSVAPQAACSISVTFQPLAKGKLSGTLAVTDDAPGSPQTVSLAGTGTYVSLEPASLDFGNRPVGAHSPSKNITLTNKGSMLVNLGKITITGADARDFLERNDCATIIPVGASCTITVGFTPTAQGTRTADVSIGDDGGGSPQLVPLTGTGT